MNSSPPEDKDSEISATEGNVLISNFYNFPRLELTPRLWLPLLILLYLSPPSTILTALFLWRHWIIIASLSAVIKRLRKSSLLLFQCKSYICDIIMLICRQVATLQLLNKRIRWMKIKNTENSTGVVLSRAQWSFLYFLWSFRNRLSIYFYTTHNLIIVYYSTYSSICTFRKVTKIIFQNLANY